MKDERAYQVFQDAIVDLCIKNGGTLEVEFQDSSGGTLHTQYMGDDRKVIFTYVKEMTLQ